MKNNWYKKIILLSVIVMMVACHSKASRMDSMPPRTALKSLEAMGYTIQAGAFAKVENAARLSEILRGRGLDATYFVAGDGLYKVRFGNFATKEIALQKAQRLKDTNIIDDYYIVRPEDYAAAKQKQYGTNYLRESLVKTAHDFLGVPYLWGGNSVDTGFDCSGLTMTVYQLNGLNLPRHSGKQFEAGSAVDISNLQKGDLVFFATKSKGKVSHVGVYIGNGRFIHAPSRGKTICIDSLSSDYFSKKFVCGKSYL